MKLIDRLPDPGWSSSIGVIATLGNFDGLHLGHQAILQAVVRRARQTTAIATVITFDPHPQRILFPERAPHLMLTRSQKLAILEAAGIDATILIPFDRTLAALDSETFVREILDQRIGVQEIYVGPDFRFGKGRSGDVALLQRLGQELGFKAEGVAPVMDGGERVSASRIRKELAQGNVAEAARLLGRPFALAGTIVHGEGRGSKRLVPTANLAPENEFLPARGVYITQTRLPDHCEPGLTNVGVRPTFGEGRLTVETFLPGLARDLYGSRIELAFLERIRDEKQFESPQALMEQIAHDIATFEAWRRTH